MPEWKPIPGETPIDPSGLRDTSIRNRKQLNDDFLRSVFLSKRSLPILRSCLAAHSKSATRTEVASLFVGRRRPLKRLPDLFPWHRRSSGPQHFKLLFQNLNVQAPGPGLDKHAVDPSTFRAQRTKIFSDFRAMKPRIEDLDQCTILQGFDTVLCGHCRFLFVTLPGGNTHHAEQFRIHDPIE